MAKQDALLRYVNIYQYVALAYWQRESKRMTKPAIEFPFSTLSDHVWLTTATNNEPQA